ncbi:hypothetical protein, partial [Pseudomonas viridiflava]|uniref:hypothetical protein n=1 Tax=Pseudomonas viridiflava TaxID=33069 RepID=UPI0019817E6C
CKNLSSDCRPDQARSYGPVFTARQRYVEDVVGTPTLRRRSTGYWSHPFNPELTLAATRGYKPRLVFLSDFSS